MSDLTALRTLPHAAADLIAQPGKWTQRTVYDKSTGAMCLTGALLRACTVPGDGYLAREVYRYWGRAERWNDTAGRTQAEVVAELHREITVDDLAETFGPQWEAIVALVRRGAVLTDDEATRLDAARDAAWDAAGDAARALSIRDLIGQHGFTQQHYDTLTRPWAQVIGPVHPDDKPVSA